MISSPSSFYSLETTSSDDFADRAPNIALGGGTLGVEREQSKMTHSGESLEILRSDHRAQARSTSRASALNIDECSMERERSKMCEPPPTGAKQTAHKAVCADKCWKSLISHAPRFERTHGAQSREQSSPAFVSAAVNLVQLLLAPTLEHISALRTELLLAAPQFWQKTHELSIFSCFTQSDIRSVCVCLKILQTDHRARTRSTSRTNALMKQNGVETEQSKIENWRFCGSRASALNSLGVGATAGSEVKCDSKEGINLHLWTALETLFLVLIVARAHQKKLLAYPDCDYNKFVCAYPDIACNEFEHLRRYANVINCVFSYECNCDFALSWAKLLVGDNPKANSTDVSHHFQTIAQHELAIHIFREQTRCWSPYDVASARKIARLRPATTTTAMIKTKTRAVTNVTSSLFTENLIHADTAPTVYSAGEGSRPHRISITTNYDDDDAPLPNESRQMQSTQQMHFESPLWFLTTTNTFAELSFDPHCFDDAFTALPLIAP